MLSENEKNEIRQKIDTLKKKQDAFKAGRGNPRDNSKKGKEPNQYSLIGIVYEFISMILLTAVGSYFIARATSTMPWTMIAISLLGFIYAFYRLYRTVSHINK